MFDFSVLSVITQTNWWLCCDCQSIMVVVLVVASPWWRWGNWLLIYSGGCLDGCQSMVEGLLVVVSLWL